MVTRDNRVVHCRTHLGRILKAGDTALGYDVSNANLNDTNFASLSAAHAARIPDVRGGGE